MATIVIICIFWLGYGIAGILGYQNIPSKYEEQPWTAQYKRYSGISWIILAVPTLLICAVVWFLDLGRGWYIWSPIVGGIPSVIYSIWFTRKYDRLLRSDHKENKCGKI